MKVVSKKISYDSIISKLPGVIPSIVDTWKIPHLYKCGNEFNEMFYNYSTAIKKAKEYNINSSELEHGTEFMNFDVLTLNEFITGNYGLIPSDIIIPDDIADSITDYTDIYVNIPNANGEFYDLSWPKKATDPHYEGRKIISGGTEIKVLTYYTLNKWYVFFKEYYNLIESPEYNKKYASALDYYEQEVNAKNEDSYAYYENLDLTFESRGGKNMYEWICNNCIIQFNIPEEFTEKWNTTFLYFADAIKWYKWFGERVEKYKDIKTIEDCKDSEDCCDCKEYIKLGGEGFYDALSQWIENHKNFNSNATNSASFTVPITFSTSIDDLGEMAILSSDWVPGTDYHNTLIESGDYETDKYSGGTVVNTPYVINEDGNIVYTYETKIIKSSNNVGLNKSYSGYTYDKKYNEISYNKDSWRNYSDDYINDNSELFCSNGIVDGHLEIVSAYTYSPVNGKIIYNPTEIKSKIKYEKVKNTCINGSSYDIIDGKYVTMCYNGSSIANISYKNNTKLQVLKNGNLEYVIFNGKKYYVEKDEDGIDKVYFLKCYDKNDKGCPVSSDTYIIYDDVIYTADEADVKIKEYNDETEYIYPILDGYFYINNNIFYVSGGSVIVSDGSIYDEENDKYTYTFRELDRDELESFGIKDFNVLEDSGVIEISHLFDEIDCTVVAGFCDSKLDLLRRKEISTDDLGNELPGHFKSIVDINSGSSQSRYNNAYNGCILDILYKTGEVASLTKNNDLSDDEFDYFNGDIITDIMFYFKDKYGDIWYNEQANNDNAIDVIENLKNYYNSSDDTENVINEIYCNITYYMNAVLKLSKVSETPSNYVLDERFHSGVKYIDTVVVKEKVGDYYLENRKKFTYIYYELKQNASSIHLSNYKNTVNSDASTYFEMRPLLYVYKNNNVEIDNSDEYFSGWSKNNNIIVAPLTRNEFNLGSSFPQNVNTNIYIDRGINAAFERHLKLQEIRTMEALETFSNGIFKLN